MNKEWKQIGKVAFATMQQLTNMNDTKNNSFVEIADWIEENL